MASGYFPITVLNRNSEEFHRELGLFYESGDANNMFRFFSTDNLRTLINTKAFWRPIRKKCTDLKKAFNSSGLFFAKKLLPVFQSCRVLSGDSSENHCVRIGACALVSQAPSRTKLTGNIKPRDRLTERI